MENLVSIIMNCFNGEKYLEKSLNSIVSQKYKNWELIFWDNQSTDNSKKIFQSFSNSNFKYFLSKKHTTLYEARNLACKKAQGEYIAFLDCDDLWMPSKLLQQIPEFNQKDIGIVISDTIFFNEKGQQKQLYKKRKPFEGHVFKELLKND